MFQRHFPLVKTFSFKSFMVIDYPTFHTDCDIKKIKIYHTNCTEEPTDSWSCLQQSSRTSLLIVRICVQLSMDQPSTTGRVAVKKKESQSFLFFPTGALFFLFLDPPLFSSRPLWFIRSSSPPPCPFLSFFYIFSSLQVDSPPPLTGFTIFAFNERSDMKHGLELAWTRVVVHGAWCSSCCVQETRGEETEASWCRDLATNRWAETGRHAGYGTKWACEGKVMTCCCWAWKRRLHEEAMQEAWLSWELSQQEACSACGCCVNVKFKPRLTLWLLLYDLHGQFLLATNGLYSSFAGFFV